MFNNDLTKWDKVAIIVIWLIIASVLLVGICGGWAYLLSLLR